MASPLAAPAVKAIEAVPLPAVILLIVGASGAVVVGVTDEALEAALSPTPFTAITFTE